MVTNARKRIGYYDICCLFGRAYAKVATIEKALSGFRSSGCWPFDPDVFTDQDFAPSLMTEDAKTDESRNLDKGEVQPEVSRCNNEQDALQATGRYCYTTTI